MNEAERRSRSLALSTEARKDLSMHFLKMAREGIIPFDLICIAVEGASSLVAAAFEEHPSLLEGFNEARRDPEDSDASFTATLEALLNLHGEVLKRASGDN